MYEDYQKTVTARLQSCGPATAPDRVPPGQVGERRMGSRRRKGDGRVTARSRFSGPARRLACAATTAG